MNNFPDVDFIWACLRSILDPEIGINIVDLGLIYSVNFKKTEKNTFEVYVEMTLTSPTCPLADIIINDIKTTISMINECNAVHVKVVFDPPWNSDMITANGKMELGIF